MTRLTLLTAGLLLAGFTSAAADDKPKAATLRWFGQSFFQVETSTGQRIVFDPHAIPAFGGPRVSADVTLLSHLHDDHAQPEVLAEKGRVFFGLVPSKDGRRADWNAVDEKVLTTRVRTLPTYHDALAGMQRGKNSIWVVEADGLVFCHLGDLGHELTDAQVKAIGPVDVLMIPVGGTYTINGEQAKKIVGQIKPRRFVVPMHYGVPGYDDLVGPEEFLDGQKNVKRMLETNELVIPLGDKAPDAATVVVLGFKKEDPVPAKK
ncbi:MAG: MBL fold metallo-hydrolase [Gemmataceae bacterium]|nr:MBL fold metallo-hydrolase [Gemmataceae bacterium]